MGPNYALPEAAETPELRLGRLLHQQQDGPGFRSQERKSGREKNSIFRDLFKGLRSLLYFMKKTFTVAYSM